MAKTFERFTGDGSSNQFPVNFPYIDIAHVHVYIDSVEDTAFTWVNWSEVQTSTVPANNAVIEVRRQTPTVPLTDFVDGSTLAESDLDRVLLQSLYVVEESQDTLTGLMRLDSDDTWDALTKRIKNVADAVNSGDAVSKGYLDTNYVPTMQTLLSDTQAARDAAQLAASNAATSETNAASSASAASTSASAAATSETNAATSETNAGNSAAAASVSETNAANSETAAASSATNAGNSAASASTSASAASTSEINAASSASAASTSASSASTSATDAGESKTTSQRYAVEAENIIVVDATTGTSTGDYSAYHWAQKAQEAATGSGGSSFGGVYAGNYADLQSAINAAQAANAPLWLEPGATYNVSTMLTAAVDNTNDLIIHGQGATIVGSMTSGHLMQVTVTGTPNRALLIEDLHLNTGGAADGLLVRNGSVLTGTGPNNYGVIQRISCTHGALRKWLLNFENVRHINIKDCNGKSQNGDSAGVRIYSDNGLFCGDLVFSGCEFTRWDNSDGVPILLHAVGGAQVRGVHFTDVYPYNGGSQMLASGAGSFVGDVYFNHCQWDIYDGGRAMYMETNNSGKMDNIIFDGCYFQAQSGTARFIEASNLGSSFNNIQIVNCQLGGLGSSATGAISTYQVEDLVVSGCQFGVMDVNTAVVEFNDGNFDGMLIFCQNSWRQRSANSAPILKVYSSIGGALIGNILLGAGWDLSGFGASYAEAGNLL